MFAICVCSNTFALFNINSWDDKDVRACGNESMALQAETAGFLEELGIVQHCTGCFCLSNIYINIFI